MRKEFTKTTEFMHDVHRDRAGERSGKGAMSRHLRENRCQKLDREREASEESGQDMPGTKIDRSDLVEWANHEHVHLSKLFDDLRQTFNEMAQGELEGDSLDEALALAFDDLEGGLEDMLEHFNEEEEVYFLAIEQRFPEYATQIDHLTQTHEVICEKIQRLQRHIREVERDLETGERQELSARLIALVNSLAVEVERHNEQEQAVFEGALKRLSVDEQIALLDKKRALGQ